VMLSPLQLLMVYNAVANDGKMMKPYLVNAIMKDGIVINEKKPVVLNSKICSDETLKQLQECLEAVITEGTGREVFKSALYTAGGKTGTAKVNDGKFKYADGVYQAAFAGYFPAKDPVYSCIVVIKNKPHAAKYYGGAVAAPVFREIADKLYATHLKHRMRKPEYIADSMRFYYAGYSTDIEKVYKTFGWEIDQPGESSPWSLLNATEPLHPVMQPVNYAVDVIPDVKGMGLKDALYLLESKGLRVVVAGRGKVKNQSLSAGKPIKTGDIIQLELN
jgi:cell division protein FtsI (penicillin-binding protein 3)